MVTLVRYKALLLITLLPDLKSTLSLLFPNTRASLLLVALGSTSATAASLPTSYSPRVASSAAPAVKVRNGTYTGVHSEEFNQDFFLGIPYARQPVGDLRFRVPQSLNETWDGERNATEFGAACPGYQTSSLGRPIAEDCLTLNVVRPASVANATEKLPVVVWIHGGAFFSGSGSEEQYNSSFLISHAQSIGKPIIVVTINYRLAMWGFMYSMEGVGMGNTNMGLRDQRLALHWIQENIAAFGGDPQQVTIWGQSAGGISVGYHLTAYGGRDDGLFRAAILQAGSSIMPNPYNTTYSQGSYDFLLQQTSCDQTLDRLACLQSQPFETLDDIFKKPQNMAAFRFNGPIADGDFLQNWGSLQLSRGDFVKVPIISGANTDEGISFGPSGINTTDEFYSFLTSGTAGYVLPQTAAKRMLELYPDEPSQGIPAFLGDERIPAKGLQWRRTSAYAGDETMHANRRKQCQVWTASGLPVYSYRFNVLTNDVGIGHGDEVPFVFANTQGVGIATGNPFADKPQSYVDVSRMMATMWVSFVHDLDPNTGISNATERWEKYDNGNPKLMVFDANVTSHLENDTWRKEGIDFINSLSLVLGR